MEYIHSQQAVHRDIKPSNIIITRNGDNVKLIDFGLSDTDSHAVFKQPAGTKGYMSPEQQLENSTDQRNDIYSLGCVLEDLNLKHMTKSVIRRCKQPIDKRYANVRELRRAFLRSMRVPYYIITTVCLAAVVALVTGAAIMNVEAEDGNIFMSKGIKYKILSTEEKSVEVNDCIYIKDGLLTIPSTVRYRGKEYKVEGIGDYAFWEQELKSVNLPASLKYICTGAFYKNDFETFMVPDSTIFVGRDMVVSCKKLKSVVIGSSVEKIEIHVFGDCVSLRDIFINTKQPPMAKDLFGDEEFVRDNVTLHVPRGSEELYRNAAEWKRFKNIMAD